MKSRVTTEDTDTTPRVYVASLSDYNNGNMLGRWFAFCDYDDGAELLTDVYAMLKTYDSIYPLPFGQKREAWSCFDYENFPERFYSESMSFEKLYEYLDAVADMDEDTVEAFNAFVEDGNESGDFRDCYLGQYGDRPYDDDFTAATYAEESYYEQYGKDSIPKQLQGHIDWNSMARDLVLGGDIFVHKGHVFANR